MDGQPDNWRQMLRTARKALRLDQTALARAVGISRETLRSYENGRRVPRREHLEQLILALKLPARDGNAMREALGYLQAESVFRYGKTPNYFTLDELPRHVAQYPWPSFVVNDAVEVVVVNEACEAVWGIDFETERSERSRVQMNLLSVASDRHFADRVVNWREVLDTMVGVYKANAPAAHDLEDDNPWFREILVEFSKGDPRFIAELIDSYANTPPVTLKYRWDYRVIWRHEEFGEMRFACICSTANEPEALSFNDWHPIDAESWRVLEVIKAAHAASRGAAK